MRAMQRVVGAPGLILLSIMIPTRCKWHNPKMYNTPKLKCIFSKVISKFLEQFLEDSENQ